MNRSERQRAIWGVMADKGYNPVWTETITDGHGEFIAMGFDMLGNPQLPWVKAFMIDAANATPALFEGEIKAWKRKKRQELAEGQPVPVVRQAIAMFGEKRVKQVLGALHAA